MNGEQGDTFSTWLAEANRLLAGLPQLIDRVDWQIAAVLIPLGVISLLYGYRVFKGMVVVYCSVAGAAGGWWLVSVAFGRPDLWWVGLLAGGAIMALVAWPLVRVFVGIWGAVAGGMIGFAVTQAVGDQRAMLIGVGAGVVVGAILAAVVFRFMVVLTTSVLGACLTVVGLAALVYRVDRVGPALREQLESNHYVLPLVLAVPTVLGVIYQLRRSERRESAEDAGKEE